MDARRGLRRGLCAGKQQSRVHTSSDTMIVPLVGAAMARFQLVQGETSFCFVRSKGTPNNKRIRAVLLLLIFPIIFTFVEFPFLGIKKGTLPTPPPPPPQLLASAPTQR